MGLASRFTFNGTLVTDTNEDVVIPSDEYLCVSVWTSLALLLTLCLILSSKQLVANTYRYRQYLTDHLYGHHNLEVRGT